MTQGEKNVLLLFFSASAIVFFDCLVRMSAARSTRRDASLSGHLGFLLPAKGGVILLPGPEARKPVKTDGL